MQVPVLDLLCTSTGRRTAVLELQVEFLVLVACHGAASATRREKNLVVRS